MRKYRLKRYLGIVFIAVVIAPAIALSLIALRAISHEEAYIEKQIEGTLSAEVAHVSGVVTTELDRIQTELAGTIVIPEGPDAAGAFEEWKQRSALVEIPFLLSPAHEILWPTSRPTMAEAKSAPDAMAAVDVTAPPDKETSFLKEQHAFLENEERTPVYENIAEAYKNDILAEVTETEETILPTVEDRFAAVARGDEERTEYLQSYEPKAEEVLGEKTRAKTALSQFQQSEPVRQMVYDKAEREGQQFSYRNVQVDDAAGLSVAPREAGDMTADEAVGVPTGTAGEVDAVREVEVVQEEELVQEVGVAQEVGAVSEVMILEGELAKDGMEEPAREVVEVVARKAAPEVARATSPQDRRDEPAQDRGSVTSEQPEPETLGRIRSIFISQPQSFSEIVSRGESGIIPRTIDGNLQLLYWQKAVDGNIVGCLINSDELKDRLIGALPGIYSSVRILTILDEKGRPLIVPPGQEERDWQRPLVAGEISELLPRWEVASYLTDPDVISSRAQVATSLMWVLIVILFVAILVGGTLVVRSTYAEMRLAQQKTSFVANVSHELKTPLTSIRLFAEMLRDGRQRDEQKQKQYLDIMAAETERLTRLVNNVLDFSRMERGEKRYTMRRCDLIAVCAGVVETHRARLENNGFEVVFTTHTGSLITQADEEALKQALVNLLSNSEKYSPDIKQVEIDVRQDDGSAVIAISDRGIGIPVGEAGRIFDEFYRVDDALTSRVKGAGLGLTIARRILKGHGGDLKYSPREGGGSTFELIIPLSEEQA